VLCVCGECVRVRSMCARARFVCVCVCVRGRECVCVRAHVPAMQPLSPTMSCLIHLQLKAAYTSSLRPHTLVAVKAAYTSSLTPHTLVA
jgi:hypothetical protein